MASANNLTFYTPHLTLEGTEGHGSLSSTTHLTPSCHEAREHAQIRAGERAGKKAVHEGRNELQMQLFKTTAINFFTILEARSSKPK